MEEELGGCEAGQVGILHKATTLGPIVILDEMGQSPVLEPKWDPLALHILLPDNSNDLGSSKVSASNFSALQVIIPALFPKLPTPPPSLLLPTFSVASYLERQGFLPERC